MMAFSVDSDLGHINLKENDIYSINYSFVRFIGAMQKVRQSPRGRGLSKKLIECDKGGGGQSKE